MSSSYVPPHKRSIGSTSRDVSLVQQSTSIPSQKFSSILIKLEDISTKDLRTESVAEIPSDTSSSESEQEKSSQKRRVKTTYSAPTATHASYRRISSPDRKTPPIPEESTEIIKKETMSWSNLCKGRLEKKDTRSPSSKEKSPPTIEKKPVVKDSTFIFIPHSSSIVASRRKKASTLMNSNVENEALI